MVCGVIDSVDVADIYQASPRASFFPSWIHRSLPRLFSILETILTTLNTFNGSSCLINLASWVCRNLTALTIRTDPVKPLL